MAMVPYALDGGDADWYPDLDDGFPLLRSSSSPFDISEEDNLLSAVAPPDPPRSLIRDSNLEGSDHSPLLLPADFSASSAVILMDEDSYRLPMFPAAVPPAAGDQFYFDGLPPLPATIATAGVLDDVLMLQPFSDIDLDAFGGSADVNNAAPPDNNIMIVPSDRPCAAGQVAGVDGLGNKHVATAADCYHPVAASSFGFNMAVMRHGEHQNQASSVVALPPPPPMPRPHHQVRMRSMRSGTDRSAPPAGKTRLDQIGFDDIRKYFYMPITKAAREMNVGLTVLKKRCRELGVARWPHRKMKSLKSLILNVQEMGKGMSPAAVRRELAALETYCALMEEDPSIELTDRTKKLRQACFKESYKRRRAAHRFGRADQLTVQEASSSNDDGCSLQSSHLFSY